MSSHNVLSPRDSNAQMKPASPEKKAGKMQTKSLESHREELQAKLNSSDTTQQYISPSDSIQSPATQKLAAMRNKHVLKKGKPKTLFETTSSKNLESTKSSLLFADIPKQNKQPQPVETSMDDATSTDGAAQVQDGQAPVFSRDLNKSPVFEHAVPVAQAQQVASAPADPADPERSAPMGDEPKDV